MDTTLLLLQVQYCSVAKCLLPRLNHGQLYSNFNSKLPSGLNPRKGSGTVRDYLPSALRIFLFFMGAAERCRRWCVCVCVWTPEVHSLHPRGFTHHFLHNFTGIARQKSVI